MDLKAFFTSAPFLAWTAVMVLCGIFIFIIMKRK